MDELDRSQQETELQLANTLALREQQRAALAAIPPADNCTECGEPIPLARQALCPGCQHCVACAQNFEQLTQRK